MDWFGWLFLQPPALWQWIGIFIGIPAFLGVIVTLYHIFGGKPKITTTFESEDIGGHTFLSCLIWNLPIVKGIRKLLGVQREDAKDIAVSFEIQERGTGKVICPMTPVKIRQQQGIMLERIALPASLFPARFAIAYIDAQNRVVKIYRQPEQTLLIGAYTAIIQLFVGPVVSKHTRNFYVDNSAPFAYWD